MFWLIATIISLLILIGVSLLKAFAQKYNDDYDGLNILFGIMLGISGIWCMAVGISGAHDYKTLMGNKYRAEAMAAQIVTIKDLGTSSTQSGSYLIDGRADFIKSYSSFVSAYNSYLEVCQRIMSTKSGYWFRGGSFMDDRIANMQPLEIQL